MTQEEAAARFSEATGRKWTKNSVGAAERAREVGRLREFNAEELVAFGRVFGVPVAFFLLPPDDTGKDQEFHLGPDGQTVTRLSLLSSVLLFRPSSLFVDDANAATRVHGLSWSPAHPSWYRPEDDFVPEEPGVEYEPPRPTPAADDAGVIDGAQRLEVLRLLDRIRRVVSPQDEPPF
ncbi:hypothetical protein [Acrocarpospora macrocephala]|uniref:hypothetical protein n=1 Tax=Acrocarpospora macrocephala TaxID=150177 RepID=UPI0012D32BC7|nr:hypothetical protein [Acrocarpospora macrocephala]